MIYQKTAIEGVWIITPHIYPDERGYFMETYNEDEFDREIGTTHFLQDNQSHSVANVLRGLHYQAGQHAQAKLVRVLQGCVFDVAVDLRQSSPTFGRYVGVQLSAANGKMLFIPRGFAHGFAVLSHEATFAYKVDNHYHPQAERCLRFDVPEVGIEWPIDVSKAILSDKDRLGSTWQQAELFD